MLKLLSIIPLAQVLMPTAPALPTNPAIPAVPGVQLPRFHQVVQPQEVRLLPGQLDSVPVFNSNSPEVVQQDGILLSTFPSEGMRNPSAHLNYAFNGRFDIFAHHIARGVDPDDVRTMFIGFLVHNPSPNQTVTVRVLQDVSYLSQEAPFYDLPSYVVNDNGDTFAGPGSRTTTDVLRGLSQSRLPNQVTLPPGRTQLLWSAPIPLRNIEALRNGVPLPQFLEPDPGAGELDEAEETAVNAGANGAGGPVRPRNRALPINGRTAIMYLSSNGPVYLASLAMYGRLNANGSERAPTLQEWHSLLVQGDVAGPRDRPPTPPNTRRVGRFYYGRVAGVSQGSEWTARLTDAPDVDHLTIPRQGSAIAYAISTVDNNTLGTGQIQSAPMLARYPDTAYRAHGNYGIRYQLSLPLYNNTDSDQEVALVFQTPLKDESLRGQALRFTQPADGRIFFRGTIRIRYENDWGVTQTRYIHVVQRRGQQGEPLLTLNLRRGDRRQVEVDFLYPPDATPPQALTIETLAPRSASAPAATNGLE